MIGDKVQFFYEEIKVISEELGKLEVPSNFMKVAKEKDEIKLFECFEQFADENPELWERMSELYEEYDRAGAPFIFSEDSYEYDPSVIEPINLCFVFAFSNGMMDDCKTFEIYECLQTCLEETGYNEFAEFLENDCINTLDSLIDIASINED